MVSSISSFLAVLSAVLVVIGFLILIFDGKGSRSQPGDDVILAWSAFLLAVFCYVVSLLLKVAIWVFM